MTAPNSDFETVPAGTIAKMERMREALEACKKLVHPADFRLHPKVAALVDAALEDKP